MFLGALSGGRLPGGVPSHLSREISEDRRKRTHTSCPPGTKTSAGKTRSKLELTKEWCTWGVWDSA